MNVTGADLLILVCGSSRSSALRGASRRIAPRATMMASVSLFLDLSRRPRTELS